MVPLPKLTKDLTRVYFIQITKLHAFCTKIIIQKVLNLIEVLVREDCVYNELMVMDMTNIVFEDYIKLTPTFFMHLSTIYEKLCKTRLRGVYIINCKPYISKILSFVKPIMKAKLFERICCDPGVESLHKVLSMDQIPRDFGGEGYSIAELNEMLQEKYLEYKDLFEQLDNIKINEDLRPEKLNNDEILGYYGNFKQLSID